MRANTTFLLKKGYINGIGSGITWGLDAVLVGIVMTMAPFVENPILLVGGGFVCSMLHDVFAAVWMLLIMGYRGQLKKIVPAIKSRDGLFCVLGALFGGPFAMTFYMMAIVASGAALAATVTSCYPLLGSFLAVLILKEKVKLRNWLGLFICILGIIYIGYSPETTIATKVGIGIEFSLLAAIGWASESAICGYGMKSGDVSPLMALLIREITSASAYLFIVLPIMLKGYGNAAEGIWAVFSYFPCWILLAITALIGMLSFLMWYTSIDLIGASKGLCLNVTYPLWAVVFTVLITGSVITQNIVVGSVLIVSGVTITTLVGK